MEKDEQDAILCKVGGYARQESFIPQRLLTLTGRTFNTRGEAGAEESNANNNGV